MPPTIALALSLAFIAFLFYRDIKNHPAVSQAVWIPFIWLFLNGSRGLSGWLDLEQAPRRATLEEYAEGTPLDRNVVIVLVLVSIFILVKRRVSFSRFSSNNRILLLFALYCLLSVLWSDFPFIALKRVIKFVGMIPIVLLFYSERSPVEAIVATLRRCAYAMLILSLLFLKYFPAYGRYYNRHTGQMYFSGIGTNKNDLGMVCAVAFLVIFWQVAQNVKRPGGFFRSIDDWTDIFFLVLTVFLAIRAQSSTANMCMILAALTIIGSRLPLIRNNPAAIGRRIAGALVLLAGLQAVFNIYDVAIRALGRDPTLTGRTKIWETLLQMVRNPIVGAGYESFWNYESVYSFASSMGTPINQAHNGYLETYLNLGIIGVILFAGILIANYRSIVRRIPEAFDFNQLRLAVLVVFIFYNFTEAVFPRPCFLFFVFLIFFMNGFEESRSEGRAAEGADLDGSIRKAPGG